MDIMENLVSKITEVPGVEISDPRVDRQELADRCENLIKRPEFQKLNENICTHYIDLETELEGIEKKTPPIVEESYLWGAFNSFQPKESLRKFYTEYVESSKKVTEVMRDTYEYMGDILRLMALLAGTERDLYHLIDDNEVSAAEFSTLVSELFEESDIKDERVEQLFIQSFERAFTLRDRINLLRKELNNRIDDILFKFEDLDEKIESEKQQLTMLGDEQRNLIIQAVSTLINQVKSDMAEATSKCADALKECHGSVEQISMLEKEILAKLNEEASNERKSVHELSTNLKDQLRSSTSALIDQVTAEMAETASKCTAALEECNDSVEKISTLEKEILAKLNEAASNERDSVHELGTNLKDELHSSASALIDQVTSDLAAATSKCTEALDQCKVNAENISRSLSSLEASMTERLDEKISIAYSDIQNLLDNKTQELNSKILSMEKKNKRLRIANSLIMIILGLASISGIVMSII